MKYEAVVIGVSAGGLEALSRILPCLPVDFPVPVIVVQHLSSAAGVRLPRILDEKCQVRVRQAEEKEDLRDATVYVAPADYHILVEEDRTLSLTVDDRISYARPSVDVLFESAAEVYNKSLIGVVLTGAGRDGSDGLRKIAEYGGLTVVQDPETAEAPLMPESASKAVSVAQVVHLDDIGPLLVELCMRCGNPDSPSSEVLDG